MAIDSHDIVEVESRPLRQVLVIKISFFRFDGKLLSYRHVNPPLKIAHFRFYSFYTQINIL